MVPMTQVWRVSAQSRRPCVEVRRHRVLVVTVARLPCARDDKLGLLVYICGVVEIRHTRWNYKRGAPHTKKTIYIYARHDSIII